MVDAYQTEASKITGENHLTARTACSETARILFDAVLWCAIFLVFYLFLVGYRFYKYLKNVLNIDWYDGGQFLSHIARHHRDTSTSILSDF